jgi:hypothetical protein
VSRQTVPDGRLPGTGASFQNPSLPPRAAGRNDFPAGSWVRCQRVFLFDRTQAFRLRGIRQLARPPGGRGRPLMMRQATAGRFAGQRPPTPTAGPESGRTRLCNSGLHERSDAARFPAAGGRSFARRRAWSKSTSAGASSPRIFLRRTARACRRCPSDHEATSHQQQFPLRNPDAEGDVIVSPHRGQSHLRIIELTLRQTCVDGHGRSCNFDMQTADQRAGRWGVRSSRRERASRRVLGDERGPLTGFCQRAFPLIRHLHRRGLPSEPLTPLRRWRGGLPPFWRSPARLPRPSVRRGSRPPLPP